MINKLSRYMESSGKTYQNHYVTILKWYEEDKDKLRQKGLNKKMNYHFYFTIATSVLKKLK
ncbi:hypothetical protein CWI16_09535 [Streptococcus pneumoniae]|nr:hypothetical protein CWI16_09535 [Streptococcus pneumoniae]